MAEVKLIKVKVARKSDKTVLWDRHPLHPGGEVWIDGFDTQRVYEVFPTDSVVRCLNNGALVAQDGGAEDGPSPFSESARVEARKIAAEEATALEKRRLETGVDSSGTPEPPYEAENRKRMAQEALNASRNAPVSADPVTSEQMRIANSNPEPPKAADPNLMVGPVNDDGTPASSARVPDTQADSDPKRRGPR